MDPARPVLRRHRVAELSPEQMRAVGTLLHRVFPDPESTVEQRLERFLATPAAREGEAFIAWDGEVPVAHAMISAREVRTPTGSLIVMALAGVYSAPERRGEGLGRLVVRATFDEVDRGAYAVSLFQTGVPGFYDRLGARTVGNPFVNSRYVPPTDGRKPRGSAEQPWWNPFVMIYPATFPWPAGTVDLLGPGY